MSYAAGVWRFEHSYRRIHKVEQWIRGRPRRREPPFLSEGSFENRENRCRGPEVKQQTLILDGQRHWLHQPAKMI
jgi:hypothetical protein